MNALSGYLISVFFICIETWIIVYLSTGFFHYHKSRRFFFLSIICFLATDSCWLFVWDWFLAGHTLVKYLGGAIIISIWLVIVYDGSIIKYLFFSAFILSYFTVIDNLFISMFSAPGLIQFSIQDPYALFSLSCCAKVIEVFGIIFVRNIVKKKALDNAFRLIDLAKTSLFPFSTLIISVIMSRIILYDLKYSKEYATCMLVMLLIDLISISFLEQLDASQRALRENAILRQNLKLETDHITSLQENYEQQRKQTHDFYNQLATLQGMADKGVPPEDFSKYLGRLLATKPPAIFYINTHRIVVDVVLSQKVPYARDEGIDFQLHLEDLAQFPLPDDALVVILTNLIDNAIEACKKVPAEQERFIQLIMKIEGKKAWLCIENTTAAPVEIHDNYVFTTKGDPLLHGYGLKNIAALIKQNSGAYILDYREKDRHFCFYSTIPVKG